MSEGGGKREEERGECLVSRERNRKGKGDSKGKTFQKSPIQEYGERATIFPLLLMYRPNATF